MKMKEVLIVNLEALEMSFSEISAENLLDKEVCISKDSLLGWLLEGSNSIVMSILYASDV